MSVIRDTHISMVRAILMQLHHDVMPYQITYIFPKGMNKVGEVLENSSEVFDAQIIKIRPEWRNVPDITYEAEGLSLLLPFNAVPHLVEIPFEHVASIHPIGGTPIIFYPSLEYDEDEDEVETKNSNVQTKLGKAKLKVVK